MSVLESTRGTVSDIREKLDKYGVNEEDFAIIEDNMVGLSLAIESWERYENALSKAIVIYSGKLGSAKIKNIADKMIEEETAKRMGENGEEKLARLSDVLAMEK